MTLSASPSLEPSVNILQVSLPKNDGLWHKYEPHVRPPLPITIMKNTFPVVQAILHQVVFCLGLSCLTWADALRSAEPSGEFSKPIIDLGIVVRDADRTARFLTNAIGFKEARGFAVTGEMGRKIGLIDGQAATVRVFVLEETDQATRIKVLAFPAAKAQQPDQAYIHSALGIRYLTLYVKDINRALERLKQARVPLLGETPYDLGNGSWLVAVKDPDGNFIELIGPRR
jgi:catechol 2,3-dioxygenase-like lactoylglutathione lyase family enzyme